MKMNSEKLLIVGCGDIGERLAQTLQGLPYQLTGLRRNPPAVNDAIDYRRCDVHDRAALKAILQEHYAVIVVTMTPSERSDAGYRQAYVDTCHTLVESLKVNQLTPRLLLFVSSTGVYGQNDGSLVDESSPTLPDSFTGQRLLEAESVISRSGFAHCIVRFSGIYGPGRNRLVEQVRAGHAKVSPAWTNRIHADDCAGVLAHLLECHRRGEPLASVYLASDCAPAPMGEVVCWLAQRLGVSLGETLGEALGKRLMENLAGALTANSTDKNRAGKAVEGYNKRCSNRALLSSGYHFRHPDYRSGYSSLLTETS